jgi:hypothetical protein
MLTEAEVSLLHIVDTPAAVRDIIVGATEERIAAEGAARAALRNATMREG